MQEPTAPRLKWKAFSGGQLLMAAAVVGYFEIESGGRCRHITAGRSGLHAIDLGPCSQGTLVGCMAMCEDYQRTTLSAELQHKQL